MRRPPETEIVESTHRRWPSREYSTITWSNADVAREHFCHRPSEDGIDENRTSRHSKQAEEMREQKGLVACNRRSAVGARDSGRDGIWPPRFGIEAEIAEFVLNETDGPVHAFGNTSCRLLL